MDDAYAAPTGAALTSPTPRVLHADEFESVYRSQWNAVVSYARVRLGRLDAHDVAAEAFTRAWERRHQYESARGTPEMWLWGIVRNAVADVHRRREPPTEELTASHRARGTLDDAAGAADDVTQLLRAVEVLPEIDKDILALRFGAGLSNSQVGAMLGLKTGTVAVRLHRAIQRIRAHVEAEAGS